jgi:hypothetical protein
MTNQTRLPLRAPWAELGSHAKRGKVAKVSALDTGIQRAKIGAWRLNMATTNTHIRIVGGSVVGGSCRCGLPECEKRRREHDARREAIMRAQEEAFDDITLPSRCVGAERLPLSLAVPLASLCAA